MFWDAWDRRIGYWWSIVILVGHLLATAVIFTALFTLGWLVSIALHTLHGYHPFPTEVFNLVARIELYVIYADAVVSGIVLTAGTAKFCKERILEVVR